MSALAADATRGVSDPGLRDLLRDHWQALLEASPVWASTLGYHQWDDRISDNSAAAIAEVRRRDRELLARAEKLPRAAMSPADRITLDLFIGAQKERIAVEVCELHQWSVSAMNNPVSEFNVLPEHHVVKTLVKEITSLAESSDEKLAAKTTVLIENVEHHATEEEDEMFPLVREHMPAEQREILGRELEQAKTNA